MSVEGTSTVFVIGNLCFSKDNGVKAAKRMAFLRMYEGVLAMKRYPSLPDIDKEGLYAAVLSRWREWVQIYLFFVTIEHFG